MDQQKRMEDQEEFGNTFDELQDASEEDKEAILQAKEFETDLAQKLNGMFSDVERERREYEDRWLADLRQYKGEYDPETLAKMDDNRSKAFMRLTRTKVKSVDSRMMDLLFPANGDKNWSIDTTAEAKVDPILKQEIQQELLREAKRTAYQQAQAYKKEGKEVDPERLFEQLAGQITQEVIDERTQKIAEDRCKKMAKTMEDQLDEIKYRDTLREVIHSGNLYGTGILKGPLVDNKVHQHWRKQQEGGWILVYEEALRPFVEWVPVWDVYPDMTASKPEEMRYVFQRHIMQKHEVAELSKRPDFDGEAINSYLEAFPNGDSEVKYHEDQLKSMGVYDGEGGQHPKRNEGKYDIKEFWGYLDGQELADFGMDISDEMKNTNLIANVWIMGKAAIKVTLAPISGMDFPYYWYFYDKDETSIFGEGISSIMRDTQELFNASIRAMLDNAAIAAGPLLEVNEDLLSPDEDATDLHPFRIFTRRGRGIESQQKAIGVSQLPSYTNEFMGMAQLFSQYADETTAIPRYMHGDSQGVSGAGRTASGMSMLMGSASLTIKDQIRNFDDGITKPFISNLYHWNMQFNEDNEVKGDYEVKAEGSVSLVAKEVRAQHINEFLSVTSNEVDAPYTNRPYLIAETAKALELGEEAVKSEEQVQKEQQQKAQQQMEMAKKQNEMEVEKEVSIAEGKERAESISNQTRNIDPADIAQIKKVAQEEGVPDEVVASSVLQKEQENNEKKKQEIEQKMEQLRQLEAQSKEKQKQSGQSGEDNDG